MPQHLLNIFELRAVFQQMRCKTVPKNVRGHMFWQPDFVHNIFYHITNRARLQPVTGVVDKLVDTFTVGGVFVELTADVVVGVDVPTLQRGDGDRRGQHDLVVVLYRAAAVQEQRHQVLVLEIFADELVVLGICGVAFPLAAVERAGEQERTPELILVGCRSVICGGVPTLSQL